MYKTLGISVVLLAAFAFMSGSRSADASPTTGMGPVIVARAKLVNQMAPIPTTTIFTPTQSGLYRLSVYATISKTDPAGDDLWTFIPSWTDDGGNETYFALLVGPGATTGQFQSYDQTLGLGGVSFPFEAKAGTPITYSVIDNGPSGTSAYSLYYTLERLE